MKLQHLFSTFDFVRNDFFRDDIENSHQQVWNSTQNILYGVVL